MQGLLDKIEQAIREFFIGLIESNLTTMFVDVNEKTATIAEQIGQTPQGWNGNIFSMIRSLSETVIIPIAGMIITLVLCYELITMITEKNNLHDGDSFSFSVLPQDVGSVFHSGTHLRYNHGDFLPQHGPQLQL